MTDLTLALSDDLRARLQGIADRTGRTLDDCVQVALAEFVVNWETHLHDVEDLEIERPLLRAANE